MVIKLVVGGFTLNIISAYAPQAGMDEEVKRHFWEDLDEMVRGIPHTEKLFIGGDFNGHIGTTSRGYDDVHGGFGFGDRNGGGTYLLDFARAFDLMIANSSFPKKREHLVTFRSSVGETQIDYLLCKKSDRGLCTDCKVISSENLSTLHRLLVMDHEIMRKRRKRTMYSQHRINWGA
uniref:Craniofacial development protein 2-like n=1 Tax=Nicotiana tabacum TaxID=4097 RepID=A0A1S4DM43_TOBAC|nr:PREDICTED: craniofacial development protein 2-like [Nicotiana tabacum]